MKIYKVIDFTVGDYIYYKDQLETGSGTYYLSKIIEISDNITVQDLYLKEKKSDRFEEEDAVDPIFDIEESFINGRVTIYKIFKTKEELLMKFPEII